MSLLARLGRPELYTSYKQDMALLNTPAKRIWTGVLVLVALVLPFALTDDLLIVLATGFIAAIGAIGLNIVTGYAGQVSLGHAFFLAIGAYTAAVLSGDPDRTRLIGFGITSLPVWLLASGLVAGLAGLIVAPLVARLRGLYLADRHARAGVHRRAHLEALEGAHRGCRGGPPGRGTGAVRDQVRGRRRVVHEGAEALPARSSCCWSSSACWPATWSGPGPGGRWPRSGTGTSPPR